MADAVIASSVAAESVVGPGHKIEVRKPLECMEALEMMAAGAPRAEIVARTGISYQMLSVLAERHDGAIANRRERAAAEAGQLADTYREVLRQKAEQLLGDREAMKRLNPKDAALTLGILTDKEAQLRGEATAVVEHRKGFSLEDAAAMIEAARKKVQGEAIDI